MGSTGISTTPATEERVKEAARAGHTGVPSAHATLDPRLRALTAFFVPVARERVGLHAEYDGRIPDLSPAGVRGALAELGPRAAEPYLDPHDEAHARAAEDAARIRFGRLELHRSNPMLHLASLDVACYDRAYAPEEERAVARAAHLARWPDAVDAAIEALDRVPAPVAQAALPAARGLAPAAAGHPAAAAALARFTARLTQLAEHGDPSAALGGAALQLLMSAAEACPVDLGRLADCAEAERARLLDVLRDAAAPGESVAQTVRRTQADRPTAAGMLVEVTALTRETLRWVAERGLVPYDDGECQVVEAPASRRHVFAGLSPAAPGEPDAPSVFHFTPPDPNWSVRKQEEWLAFFNRPFLSAFVLHEVAPGHHSHGRALRRAPGAVRRTLLSEAFTEGWALYAEQLALEEGFRSHDRGTAIGIALSGLQRSTRLSCAIGLHTGAMTVAEAARRFAQDAFLPAAAASAEAGRGLWDPEYGHYTWGKLALLEVREQARRAWGAGYSPARFHAALLELGAPPLGLLGTAVERG
ncbi:DUF885 domain-containing protein [Streptomyces sp. YC504]|uniref:DUF885 domain-containing protein n=1 Tax=Streptomyces mesophilus TaxID=1775132 RepID=A0A6G4XKT4_9ACTN|nr:DUF885 family protein [Streptomyces mesophilus]NGO77437.1 DUF885 domain-containing protein [Streptomyces mesophilus]